MIWDMAESLISLLAYRAFGFPGPWADRRRGEAGQGCGEICCKPLEPFQRRSISAQEWRGETTEQW